LILFVNQHPGKKPEIPVVDMVRHRKEKIPDVYHILSKIGRLWLKGIPVNWQTFYRDEKRYRIPLPTYPFAGKYYPPAKDLFNLDAAAGPPGAKPLLTRKADTADWFYIPLWEQAPSLSIPAEPPESVKWLVFTDECGLGDRLTKELRKTAGNVVIIKTGEEYTRLQQDVYTLNPGLDDDYHRLFHELRASRRVPDKIIHLWNVTPDKKPGERLEELNRLLELGFYSLLNIARAVGQEKISQEIQINVVTNNMQGVSGEEDTQPGKAAIRGAVKIIPLEYVNISCSSIDILWPGAGESMKTGLVQLLLKEFSAAFEAHTRDKIVALRGDRRWCERMKPLRLEKTQPGVQRLQQEGVYLITGGLGGMGFTFAQYLAQHFRAKLVLLQRSFFPTRQDWSQWLAHHPADDPLSIRIRKIQQWEEQGAEIMVCTADVSDENQMRTVISEARQRFGPFNGVLHIAGLGDYAGMIQQRTREMTEQVMAPKVKGTWVLDRVLQENPLDFLVLFSSIGNIIYQVKFAQVGYNAANEFLEAFAYYKTRKDGTYTVTINWNDWLEVGMSIEATNRKYREHWKYKITKDLTDIDYETAIHGGLTPGQGVEVFSRILGNGVGLERVTVSMYDLQEMVRVLRSLGERDSSMFAAIEEQTVRSGLEQRPPLSTPYVPPANPLEQTLTKTWSNYFGIEPIGREDDFFELGGDSLKAMIMIHKIQKDLGVRIPLADFFNNPTVKGQAGYIHKAEKKIYTPIPLAEEKEYYPLSPAQQRIYILHHLEEKSIGYNIIHTLILCGPIDRIKTRETLQQIIKRHESLRTSFILIRDTPVQRVHDRVDFEIEHHQVEVEENTGEGRVEEKEVPFGQISNAFGELTPHRTGTHHSSFIEKPNHSFIRPFDLSQAPLLRVSLISTGDQLHLLVVDMHHIISDGTSAALLIKEFSTLYQGRELPGLHTRYKDYSEWQDRQNREDTGTKTINTLEAYWLEQLAGELPVLNLPIDYPRPGMQSFAGSRVDFEFGVEETGQLKALAMAKETTLFTVLLAICQTWLSRLSGQEDIITGTVTAGRKFQELQTIIGMFANTLALRNFPHREKTFTGFLAEVKARALTAFTHQDYPLELLVEKLAIERDTSRNPLFDVMFILQSRANTSLRLPGITVKPGRPDTGISRFDLTLEAIEQEDKLQFYLEFCSKLFKKETIDRFIKYFCLIVSQVVKEPGTRLGNIAIIPAEEKRQILYDFNDTGRTYPQAKVIHELFADQAEHTPDRTALIGKINPKSKTRNSKQIQINKIKNSKPGEGTWEHLPMSAISGPIFVTYRELNEKADGLAAVLRDKGVLVDIIVGIMMERSIEMIIAILAVLKAGGAYLPLDAGYPQDRINYMLKDSNAEVLLTTAKLQVKAEVEDNFIQPQQLPLQFINIDMELASAFEPHHSTLTLTSTCQVSPANLAYIIYTSGSTGNPKGVMVGHYPAMNLLYALQELYPFTASDTYLLKTSYTFDVSVTELFGWYTGGGRLAILETGGEKDPHIIIDTIACLAVTHINFVPSMFNVFIDALNPRDINKLFGLKYIFLAGEALLPALVNKFKQLDTPIQLENIYGPTEGTVYSSKYSLWGWKRNGPVPIGKPLPNMKLYILDRDGHWQPLGIVGQLCIGGKGVARGYLNNPELTAERFRTVLNKSYRSYMSYILYWTGDLARWLPDGNIEFLGRIDQQIKLRGFRVELGEIESRLLDHPDIKEAVLVLRTDKSGDEFLCAYLVYRAGRDKELAPGSAANPGNLREFLAQTLPDYMIPAYFIPLQQMPLTPGGKLDRKRLPAPAILPVKKYTAPRDETEKKLVEIWSGVLAIEKACLGIDYHFFEIGGHSLKAVTVVSRIHKELKVKLPLAELFKRPTIRRTANYIRDKSRDEDMEQYTPAAAVEKRDYYALSSAQRRLYFLHRMDPGSTAYNMPLVLSLQGEVKKDRLERVLQELTNRHESFRTSFIEMNNLPVQRVHEKKEVKVMVEDGDTEGTRELASLSHALLHLESAARSPQPAVDLISSFIQPFDLSCAPLIRVGLINVGKQEHLLVFDMHHIISDGVSNSVLSRDFMALYSKEDLPVLRLQYKDYAQWQDDPGQRAALEQQEIFWLKQFQGEIPVLNLPVDYPRPAIRSSAGGMLRFGINEEKARALKKLAAAENVTLFMLLLSLYNIFLYKITGQDDIIVGTPVAGRIHPDLREIVGFFVNTLPLRSTVIPGETPREFLTKIKTLTARALENQEYPFEELVDKVAVKRDTSRNPLLDAVFALLNFEQTGIKIPGRTLTPHEYDSKIARFDLSLQAMEPDRRISFTLEYSTTVFKTGTIERFKNYFLKLLDQVAQGPGIQIRDMDILPEEEKHQLLVEFNDTRCPYPANKTIHELFAEQVERTPDYTAVVGPAKMKNRNYMSNMTYISYRELNDTSGQLARLLKEKGVQPDTTAAIIMERSVQLIIALLAILKAGGAYLPVDPGYPQERIDYMLKDSCAEILVTTPVLSEKFEKLSIVNCQLLITNENSPNCRRLNNPPKEANSINNYQLTINNLQLKSTNLAYIIYTSGSTGRPKGVMVEHGSLVNLCSWHIRYYSVAPGDRAAQYAESGFDASVWEIFPYLVCGASVYIVPREIKLDIQALNRYFEKNRISIGFLPTQMCELFMTIDTRGLRVLLTGGDQLKRFIKRNYQLYNNYGPTENTVVAASYPVTALTPNIPIGKPVDNNQIYLLDRHNHLQPVGVPGELCIGGRSLARGYLNQPGLTAEKFIAAPASSFKPQPIREGIHFSRPSRPNRSYKSNKSYIYRSGDLARWLPDGNIEFLGRIDYQVKIRGFRIELGEIENQLLRHRNIQEAAVLAKEPKDGGKYLCAYIVSEEPVEIPALREYLSRTLADYMIPSYFVQVDRIPLTPGGKVNRKALPEPAIKITGQYTTPRDELEEHLVNIWSEILGGDRPPGDQGIGIDHNFFEMGGHSLTVTVLVSRIHKTLNVKIPLPEVFRKPTIRGLAGYIKTAETNIYSSIQPVEKKEYYPVSSAQKRMFLVNRFKKESDTSDNPSRAVIVEGKLNKKRFEMVIKQLINRHETMRTSFELIDDQPIQRVHESDDVEFEIEYHKVEGKKEDIEVKVKVEEEQSLLLEGTKGLAPLSVPAARGSQALTSTIKNFTRPYHLDRAPLLRIGLIQLTAGSHIILFNMHHIVCDGSSLELIPKEFTDLYDGKELPALRIQYKDFTPWQNKITVSEIMRKQEEYWVNLFPGEIPVLDLPTDYPRPVVQDFKGDYIEFVFADGLCRGLRKIARESGATLYMVLLSVCSILLARYSGQADIVVGAPIAGRQHADLEDLVGMFVNTLAMRNYPVGEKTCQEFLKEVRTNALKAYENQDYPFEELVNRLNIQRDSSRNALFDTMFALAKVDADNENKRTKDFTIKPYQLEEKSTPFDILFYAYDYKTGMIGFKLVYSQVLFKRSTIQRLVRHFTNIALEITTNPDDVNTLVKDIQLLTEPEKQELLVEMNRTVGQYPEDKKIHQLFTEQAGRTPHQIALAAQIPISDAPILKTFGVYLTYMALEEKANQLARILGQRGAGPGAIVGVMMDNSPELLVGLLGILKAGGIYLPIGPGLPAKRINIMLNDSHAHVLLTKERLLKKSRYTDFQGFEKGQIKPMVTAPRAQVKDLDRLQIPDRSVIDYEKYRPYIGQAMVKNSMSLQFSRGCVYRCAFCFKIWPKGYVCRSAENMFEEILLYYNMGIRRFGFVDDLPNFDIKESSKLYRLIIDNGLKVHLHFPNGIRGDILSKDYIDLMVEAGTVSMDLALETTSARLQKLVRKNLNLEKLEENMRYIIDNHPGVILGTQIIHGFPTETPEEARASLDFIKSLQWLHFPYIHILTIYPHTEMAEIAVKNGISQEAIQRSADLGYHQLPETHPFDKNFTQKYQAEFLDEYFLSKERLLKVLPYQMKALTEDELVQKYNNYLPADIHSFTDILKYAGIHREEIKTGCLPEDFGVVPDLNKKLSGCFGQGKKAPDTRRILLLDLSQSFSHESSLIYDVVEPPLGLMYLLTHLNRTLKNKIKGKIAKARIDFDSFDELKTIICDFKPDVIGVRSLNVYKDFFHKTISLIRQWGIPVPIIAGGPYATSNYRTMLQDKNIDLAVLGEGEITLVEVIEKIWENGRKFPGDDILKNIPGLAFVEQKDKISQKKLNREILLLDPGWEQLSRESGDNLNIHQQPGSPAYIIYTSGSTGNPKGVVIRHNSLVNQVVGLRKRFELDAPGYPLLNYIMLAAFTFDVSLMHIFLALITGAKLHLIPEAMKKDAEKLWEFIHKNKINVLNIVPAFMKAILKNLEKKKISFKYLFVGGDVFDKDLYTALTMTFTAEKIINIYGPTETTINACYHECQPRETGETIPIGKPCMNYQIYILDNDFHSLPIGIKGEIYISGPGLAQGYLNHPELTAEKFLLYRSYGSYKSYISKKIYQTGDMGRWLEEGEIEFLGRKDQQVKIRGFRIELGEIEGLLCSYPGIETAVAAALADPAGDKYLCAYFVRDHENTKANAAADISKLKEHLAKQLPGYMVPAHFVPVERIPFSSSGKVDKHALPRPGSEGTDKKYAAPGNEIEKKLVKLWADVLGIEQDRLGIDANFFESGGHSLKGTILVSRMHKTFNIKVALAQVFITPTIRGLAGYLASALKETYESLETAEKKEYYVLSSAQERLYLFQQMDEESKVYNMPMVMELEGKVDRDKLENTFKELARRHESLRTSFEMVGEKSVQKIHETAVPGHWSLVVSEAETGEIDEVTRNFIRPFDLSKAPLWRVELVKLLHTPTALRGHPRRGTYNSQEGKGDRYLLMVDMHHIITDGLSMSILINDFMALYQGWQLPPVNYQYKDYSQWQKSQKQKERLKMQEEYWLSQFEGKPSPLPMPTDYPRPRFRNYQGAQLTFRIENPLACQVKQFMSSAGVTLYMLLLAVHNILVSKYTGQEDIVVGSGTAGRRHADLEKVIGMFVNILAVRNQPAGNLTFMEFLQMVKENTLEAFKNQDYQFEELTRKLNLHGDSSGNPLFDTVCQLADIPFPVMEIPGLRLRPYRQEPGTARFDLIINGRENKEMNTIDMMISYSTELYKPSTAEEIARNFHEILTQIAANRHTKLEDISITTDLLEARTGIFKDSQHEFGF